jgi:hypothetical protein
MTDDLVPVGDKRVTTFRRLLAQSDAWRASRDTRDDAQAISEDAAVIVGGLRDMIMGAGLADVVHDRFTTEALDTPVDQNWSLKAAEGRRMLMGLARVLLDIGQVLMPGNLATVFAGDCRYRAEGEPSLVGSDIPKSPRRAERPTMLDDVRRQIVRLSHFNTGLNATSWEAEMRLIYSRGDGTLKEWNRLLGDAERQECRRVGALMRAGHRLSDEDAMIAQQATRYSADVLRAMVKSLS